MDYEPIFEFYTDWDREYEDELSNIDLGNFTPFCIDICWEGGIFTFHLAFLGIHFGRSVKIKYE